MSFGITDLFGIAAPSVGDVTESRQRKTMELCEPVRDRETGETNCIALKPMITVESTQRGKGLHALSGVTAGALSAVDTFKITSVTRGETHGEFPDYDVTARGYETYTSSDPAAPGNSTTPLTSAGVGCPLVGIVSVDVAGVNSFSVTAELEEAEIVMSNLGAFTGQEFFDPTHSFTVSGVGDYPASFVLGTDGGLNETVAEFTGAVFILETDEGQIVGESDWSVSGRHFPGA